MDFSLLFETLIIISCNETLMGNWGERVLIGK
jgi:hypothetical protein